MKDNSYIIKEENVQLYYSLLEFKDRYADEIFDRFKISRQSLSSMSKEEIVQIINLMVEKVVKKL